MVQQGMSAVVDDSFTRCFAQNPPEPWNWTWYLAPAWALGVLVRYGVLFPVRLTVLILGWIMAIAALVVLFVLKPVLPKSMAQKASAEYVLLW